MNQLEKLNPKYYPEPGRIAQDRGFSQFYPAKDSFAKAELIKLYRRSGDFLHRRDREGMANRQRKSLPQSEIDEVEDIARRLAEQLAVHRIRLLDPTKELWGYDEFRQQRVGACRHCDEGSVATDGKAIRAMLRIVRSHPPLFGLDG